MKLNPEAFDCLHNKGLALFALGKYQAAKQCYQAALAINPEHANSYASMGWLLLKEKSPKAALEYFREALRIDPNLLYAQQGFEAALAAQEIIIAVEKNKFCLKLIAPLLITSFCLFILAQNWNIILGTVIFLFLTIFFYFAMDYPNGNSQEILSSFFWTFGTLGTFGLFYGSYLFLKKETVTVLLITVSPASSFLISAMRINSLHSHIDVSFGEKGKG